MKHVKTKTLHFSLIWVLFLQMLSPVALASDAHYNLTTYPVGDIVGSDIDPVDYWSKDDNGNIIYTGSNNVGIGTTSPNAKLDVIGSIEIDPISGVGLKLGRVSGSPTIKANTDDNGWLIIDSSGAGTGKVSLNHYNSDDVILWLWGGNVGIGTTTPTQKLDVVGNVEADGLCINGDCKTSWSSVTSGVDTTLTDTEVMTIVKANDGIDSGVDADKLDGLSSESFIKTSGTQDRLWNLQLHGTDIAGWYSNAPIEIREVNLVKNTQSSWEYAPAIAFHWGRIKQTQLKLLSDGDLALGTGDGIYTNFRANDILASDDIDFNGELMPDGQVCTDGQILQKIGADNWDCVLLPTDTDTTLTDTEVMTIVKANDGSGSGVDTDLLDGKDGAYYLDDTVLTESQVDTYVANNGYLNNSSDTYVSLDNGKMDFIAKKLVGSGIGNSYDRRIVLLIPISEESVAAYNKMDGKIIASKTGGNVYDVFDIQASSVWNNTWASFTSNGQRTGHKLVTADYNGVTWLALEFSYSANPYNHMFFYGMHNASLDVNGDALKVISYYDVQTSTVLNAEINNSITDYEEQEGLAYNGNIIYHAGNDGSGSGLDADLLDGQQWSYYMPATTDNWVNESGDTITGTLGINVAVNDNLFSWTGGMMERTTNQGGFSMGSDSSVILHAGDHTSTVPGYLGISSGTIGETLYLTADGSVQVVTNLQSGSGSMKKSTFDASGGLTIPGTLTATTLNGTLDWSDLTNIPTWINDGDTVLTDTEVMTIVKANDGSGSTLDADLLDGQNGSYYLDNTDTQDLSISGGTISLTNGGSITLPDSSSTNEIQDIASVLDISNDADGGTITNLGTPILGTDAATKTYVDDLINGLSWQDPVASTSALGTCATTNEAEARFVKDVNIIYVCNGSSWVEMSSTAGIPNLAGDVTGTLTSNTIASNTIESSNIVDGTLTNTDISATAAIAGTKVSPDFGDQNIATEGTLNVGTGNTITGNYAAAIGRNNTASGYSSTVSGDYSTASGNISTASGYSSTASGDYSTASGYKTTASGDYSTASGYKTTASGNISTASGAASTASGLYSTASGYYSTASGAASTASGIYTDAGSYSEVSLGQYSDATEGNLSSWVDTDVLFEIGNGTLEFNWETLQMNVTRNNAVTVLKNGNMGIDVLAPTERLEVAGTVKATAFDGSLDWSDLTNVPSGVSDGDNDTVLTSSQVMTYVKANDGAGSGVDADLLDGYSAESFYKNTLVNKTASSLPVGWYTIAVNSWNRAIGRFGLRDTAPGRHQSVIFYASHNFGNGNSLSLLHESHFSGTPFRYIRIKEGGTYDGAMLQVYIDDATNSVANYILGDNFQSSGWIIKDWIPDGTDPGSLGDFSALTNVAAQVDINQSTNGGMSVTGDIYAGGDTTQYKVLTTDSAADYYVNKNSFANFSIGSASDTESGYIQTLDGYDSSSFAKVISIESDDDPVVIQGTQGTAARTAGLSFYNGNIGVNIAKPDYKLEVRDFSFRVGSDTKSDASISTSSNLGSSSNRYGLVMDGDGDPFLLSNGSANLAFYNGNIGIGTEKPTEKFHVASWSGFKFGKDTDDGAMYGSYGDVGDATTGEIGAAVLNLAEEDEPFIIRGIQTMETVEGTRDFPNDALITLYDGNVGIGGTGERDERPDAALMVQQNDASQKMFSVKDITGSEKISVDSTGDLAINNSDINFYDGTGNIHNVGWIDFYDWGTLSEITTLSFYEDGHIKFESDDGWDFHIGNTGNDFITLKNKGDSYDDDLVILDGMVGINTTDTPTANLVVQTDAGQTGNLTEWKNSAGSVVGSIEADGDIMFGANSYIFTDNGQQEVGILLGSTKVFSAYNNDDDYIEMDAKYIDITADDTTINGDSFFISSDVGLYTDESEAWIKSEWGTSIFKVSEPDSDYLVDINADLTTINSNTVINWNTTINGLTSIEPSSDLFIYDSECLACDEGDNLISTGKININSWDNEAVIVQVEGYVKPILDSSNVSNVCNSTMEGSIYYNTALKHFYGCNGTDWKQLDN